MTTMKIRRKWLEILLKINLLPGSAHGLNHLNQRVRHKEKQNSGVAQQVLVIILIILIKILKNKKHTKNKDVQH